MISDPSWMNSDPTLHCQVEPEPADLHAIVCVHCPFTLVYPMNRQSFQHPSPCLVLLSLHNTWLPMDCVPLRHYVLRHRGLLQSSVLQMRLVLLDALLGRSTSLSNVNHRAIHASQRVHDPGLLRSRQFVLRPFHERPFQRVCGRRWERIVEMTAPARTSFKDIILFAQNRPETRRRL